MTADRTSAFAALRSASSLARDDSALAALERDKPGHGAAELARRVKDACPDISKAGCRRAADAVLAARLASPVLSGVISRAACTRDVPASPAARRSAPSRALGRTPAAAPSLPDRLAAHRRERLMACFESCGFRHSRAWDDAGGFVVACGAPAATQETAEGWIDYKSRGYKRGLVGETVRLTVPADWGMRVRLAGLAVLDGMLTLDAERLPTAGPVEVYRTSWARQGRGVSLVVERGYIARHVPSGTTFHSTHADPEKALAGLRRKVAVQCLPAADRESARVSRAVERQFRRAEKVAALVDRIARHDLSGVAHVEVTRADSLRAGNCEPGTDGFIDRHGLAGRASATIGEIAAAVGMRGLAGLSDAEVTLARQLAAACLQAVRRDKAARRLVGA